MGGEKKYSEKDVEKLIEETTRYGAVHAILYFDAHGTDEDSVRNTLVDFVSRLSKEKGVLYCKGEVLQPYRRSAGNRKPDGLAGGTGEWPSAIELGKSVEESIGAAGGGEQAGETGVENVFAYSTSAEVKILCENFDVLLNACMRYAPVGAEILSPREIRLSLEEAQALLLDASQQAQEFTAFILKRVLKGDEAARFEEQLKRRAELGRQLMEKAKKE